MTEVRHVRNNKEVLLLGRENKTCFLCIGGNNMSGFFGNLFDFNKDGKLSSFEKAADMAAFINIMSQNDNRSIDCDDYDEDDDDDDDDDF